MHRETFFTVENGNEVWFKTDDEGEACMFVQDRADEDQTYTWGLRVVRHQNGKRKVIYRAADRISEMYGE